jgi:hypothetical protein
VSWEHLTATYVLRNARIVVAVRDGGAIVETADIEYTEGRFPSDFGDDPQEPPQLINETSFRQIGSGPADASVAIEGRIIIDGMHENGPIEIRGEGWFGYDDKGYFDGRFDPDPPVIILDSMPLPPVTTDHPEMSPDQWLEYIESIEPQTTEQFERATRARDFTDRE